jgi:hypothetical protein
MMKRNMPALLLPLLALIAGSTAARAQNWAVDLYAGQSHHNSFVPAIPTRSLMAGVRYGAPANDWWYATVAAPLDELTPFWGAAGGSLKIPFLRGAAHSFGVALGAHGYAARDAVTRGMGAGGTLDAAAFAAAVTHYGRLDLRAGAAQYGAEAAEMWVSRRAWELIGRFETAGAIQFGAGGRVVRVSDGTYPALSADATVRTGPATVSATVMRWFGSDVKDVGWSLGAGVSPGTFDVWAALQQEAREPLYWNEARRTWALGVTKRMGSRNPSRASSAGAQLNTGSALIRVPAGSGAEPLFVAGDFTGWELRPMRRAGSEWHLRVPLSPGVYRYSFVDSQGRWFVPEGTSGRRSDGFGGHVAVLVVP